MENNSRLKLVLKISKITDLYKQLVPDEYLIKCK